MCAWLEWMMLPQCVLSAPRRSGRLHKRQVAYFTKARCRRWLAGERAQLWADRSEAIKRVGRPSSDKAMAENRRRRCVHLAGEGEFARACTALVSDPPVARSTEVEAQLRAKHPRAAPPRLSESSQPPADSAPEIGVEAVEAAMRGFRRSSAPGPSGLRPDHLREALGTAHADEVATHMTSLVNLLASGRGLPAMAPFLAGASLHALPKPDNGVRPIAVGETLRRLVGKCLAAELKGQAREALFPRQLGVAVSHATEVAVHVVRDWSERYASDPTRVLIKLDIKNAFNTLSRTQMLEATRARLPAASAWAEYCYRSPSHLFFEGTTIMSETGVQQGDPLGPLLFSLGMQSALENAAAAAPDSDLIFGYLDDVCLAGRAPCVAEALRAFLDTAENACLIVDDGKCEIIPSAGARSQVDPGGLLPRAKFNDRCGFSFLGAPVGGPEFCRQYIEEKRVSRTQGCLDALAEMGDAQVALTLLRQCASYGKLVYAARSTPPALHLPALRSFDDAVRDCFGRLSGLTLPPHAWRQAALGIHLGGLGLRSLEAHAPAAYVASAANTQELCRQVDPCFRAPFAFDGSRAVEALEALNACLAEGSRLQSPPPPATRQGALSHALDARRFEELLADTPTVAGRAHLQLLRQPGAGSWLHTPPSRALDLHVDSPLFCTMLQLRLRLPVYAAEEFCPMCDATNDIFGVHARACSCGGDRVHRHNMLRNAFAANLASAGLSPELEKAGLLEATFEDHAGRPSRAQGRRPADVWVPHWSVHGAAAFDFAVTVGLRADCVREAAADGAHPVAEYERRKRHFLGTDAACRGAGLTFVPMVVEACGGGWGQSAVAAFRAVAARNGARAGTSAEDAEARLVERLGLVLQRECARAVLRRAPPGPSGWS